MSDQTTSTDQPAAQDETLTKVDLDPEIPSEQSLREAVQVLLNLIPDQQRDDENSNSSQQRQLLDDIRWTVVADRIKEKDRESLENFETILSKQTRLIAEIQKRTRMLVGV